MRLHSTKLTLLIVTALASLVVAPLGAGERLTMRVSPRFAMAPATLVIDAVAERDPANRALQIDVDSAEYHRSSRVQLSGEEAPRTTTIRYEGIPGGQYEVRVTLLGSDGRPRCEAAREVQIFSSASR
jgi:hypothetical protein